VTHEFERYYGTVFTSLFEEVPEVRIKRLSTSDSAYILNESLGLYIKHATARVSPWSFSFRDSDFEVINSMPENLKDIAFALACGFHGVCVISKIDFESTGGKFIGEPLRVTVRTVKGGSWTVSGTKGELKRTRSKTKPWEKFQDYL